MNSNNIKNNLLNNQKIHLIILFLFFFVGTLNISNYGISWDEQFSRAIGFINGKYILEVIFGGEFLKSFTKLLDLESFNQVIDSNKFNFESYVEKSYGPGFELPMAVIEIISNFKDTKDIFILRHFINFLIFSISLIYFYKFLQIKLNSNFYAFLGCCLLAMSPRIFAHSFFNSKDIIFLAYFQIANYYGYKFLLNRNSFKNILLFSISLALASAVRPLGLILLFFYLSLNFLKNKELFTWQNFKLVSLSMLMLYIFWPHLWADPINNFLEAFFYFSQVPYHENVYFFDKLVDPHNLPFYYLPVWIFVTTPEIIIFLFLFSLVLLMTKFFNKKYRSYEITENVYFTFIFIIIPILLNIILKTVLFDGWRHFYFIYPFIITTGMFSMKYFHKRILRKFFEAIICLNIFILIFWNISNNPFQYLYFNKLLIGKNSLSIFEKDYWGISNKQLIEYVNNIEKGKIKWSFHGSNLKTSLLILNSEDQKKFEQINKDNYKKKYYVFLNNRYLSKNEIEKFLKEKKFIFKIIFKGEFINGVYIENETN
tara:strand:+ start:2396 stop:4018 length:1623 start_codon:yes stop_codon:yes gene_type:complete